MARKRKHLHPDEPLRHADHSRPVSRRDFLRYGFASGAATVAGLSFFSMFSNPRAAYAALSPDMQSIAGAGCPLSAAGAGKIPFICFDLAGGANIAGSNVLVGKQGGQEDFLDIGGYNKLGLPGDMAPSVVNPLTLSNDFIDRSLGIAFHSDSAFLLGMRDTCSPATMTNVNGAVIPARSDNDTGNNPHNPMYGINRAGANGELMTLIGSRNSESGGNSVAPVSMLDPSKRPTKIDRASDVRGLVDTGNLVAKLGQENAVAVLESMTRLSRDKLGRVSTGLGMTADANIKQLLQCGYARTADMVDRYGDPTTLDPTGDSTITNIFSSLGGVTSDREFEKTASVMKLVVNGYAGAGTVTMGGFDYHTGDRATGELRDLRAGRCMGACLEYAANYDWGDGRIGIPLMLYVFSDGSVSSNGRIDDTVNGRGKGEWTSDNSSTAASFFLVYNPTWCGGRATLLGATVEEQAMHQQIGWMRANASVETTATAAANNVNLLVETVCLNYMALHGEEGLFPSTGYFPDHGLGGVSQRQRMTAFSGLTGVVNNGGKLF